MFRKIVTELAYSPTLAGNLGVYVKQLRNETSKRQIGLIFSLLALVVQLIATTIPPESANANNPEVFIDGGVASTEQYLEYYDQNARNSKDLLTSLGISRAEIAAAELDSLPYEASSSLWSMQNPRTDSSTAYFFEAANGTSSVAYYQPLPDELKDLSVFLGSSETLGGWFALTQSGASLVTEKLPPSPCSSWLDAPKQPLQLTSWNRDEECLSILNLSLDAREISSDNPSIDMFQPLDRVVYTLLAENTSDAAITVTPSVNLEDILEYSRILDYGGGEYDFDTKNLTWNNARIAAGERIERVFIMQLVPSIPATAQGQYVTASYDCTASLAFGGDVIKTPVNCPFAKSVEQTTNSLPTLSKRFNIVSAVLLATVVTFLYLRSRQLLTEIYIIRHNHLGGL